MEKVLDILQSTVPVVDIYMCKSKKFEFLARVCRICFQAVIFTLNIQNNVRLHVVIITCKETVMRTSSEWAFMRNMQGNMFHTTQIVNGNSIL